MAREFFDDPADAWGILVAGDRGHPLEAEMKAQGWTIAEDEPAYVLVDLATAIRQTNVNSTRLTIRPILAEEDRDAFSNIAGQAYGAPPEFADLFLPSLDFARDPEMIWLLADWEGQPVAAGGGYRLGSFAVICCLATLDDYRGRGFGTAIMHKLIERFEVAGSIHATLRSGPKSRPLYERLGFLCVCQHRTYTQRG